ncbi:hypothetical protein P9314_03945 [Paenibacillus validus]|uniref:hypothetical protein n=1 Tax=Paenibacillus validus TaxID=44253 RepID=UPI000FD6BC6C|nr:hypothetical protein [Paenibacillus validus]MED4599859.1 hypothetical protein [Paenibacillus validus]MED4606108.1 hypothetical protein [Paenibacillus validus]
MAELKTVLINSYTRGVYQHGTYELNENRGPTVPNVHPTYVDAVMLNAANTLTLEQIGAALSRGYITQVEYDATVALMPVPVPEPEPEPPAPETPPAE